MRDLDQIRMEMQEIVRSGKTAQGFQYLWDWMSQVELLLMAGPRTTDPHTKVELWDAQAQESTIPLTLGSSQLDPGDTGSGRAEHTSWCAGQMKPVAWPIQVTQDDNQVEMQCKCQAVSKWYELTLVQDVARALSTSVKPGSKQSVQEKTPARCPLSMAHSEHKWLSRSGWVPCPGRKA